MPSVVHHKDTVCLQGGQLGGEDIKRVCGGGGVKEVEKGVEPVCERGSF